MGAVYAQEHLGLSVEGCKVNCPNCGSNRWIVSNPNYDFKTKGIMQGRSQRVMLEITAQTCKACGFVRTASAQVRDIGGGADFG